ncbi:unnamed protein product [Soboliphyme baturini]|uniref:Uncharacterized protein n=1 Tax=Soboliphyme baturini TaxID=241478 RepID=A0A183IHF4_9BILA|nr:unnamed protein product [Soboliphyme baturini]
MADGRRPMSDGPRSTESWLESSQRVRKYLGRGKSASGSFSAALVTDPFDADRRRPASSFLAVRLAVVFSTFLGSAMSDQRM